MHQEIANLGFAKLPKPPSRLLSRPQNPELAEARLIGLQAYMQGIVSRPDLKFLSVVIEFLELHRINSGLVALTFSKLSNSNVLTYLSSVCTSQSNKYGYIASAFSDTAASSKVGIAWNIIESLKVGGLAIFSYPIILSYKVESEEPYILEPLLIKESIKRISKVHFIENTSNLVVIDALGTVNMYKFKQNGSLDLLANVELHIKAAVSDYVTHPLNANLLFTVGKDNGVRLVDFSDDDINILSSGRIQKPLKKEKEHLLSCRIVLDNVIERVIIGTNNGQLLLYSISTVPATYICSLDVYSILKRIVHISDNQMKNSNINSNSYIKTIFSNIMEINQNDNYNGCEITKIIDDNLENRNVIIIAANSNILIINRNIFLSQDCEKLCFELENCINNDLIALIKCPLDYEINISSMLLYKNFLFVSYIAGLCIINIENPSHPILLYANNKLRLGTIRDLKIVQAKVDRKVNDYISLSTSLGGTRLYEINIIYQYEAITNNMKTCNYLERIRYLMEEDQKLNTVPKANMLFDEAINECYTIFPEPVY